MSAASGAGDRPDLIGDYLATLRASLRGTPAEAELIVAEAEDHLRETVAVALATGMTEREAQEAAISAFGPVRAVVQAHEATPGHLLRGRTPAAVLGDLALAGWKLCSLGLVAIGASGLVMRLMEHALGYSFVIQNPHSIMMPQFFCASLPHNWSSPVLCWQTGLIVYLADNIGLRILSGIVGVVLLGAYLATRRLLRRRGQGPAVLLAGRFPALAAVVFGAGALTLALSQLTGFQVTAGPGTFLSGALVAALAAIGYTLRARLTRRLTGRLPRRARGQ